MEHRMTSHSIRRMQERGIPWTTVELVLLHGRRIHARGALHRFVGRKEVRAARRRGLDLSACEGVHVVCAPENGSVLTVYRNHDIGSLRKGRGRRGLRRRGAA